MARVFAFVVALFALALIAGLFLANTLFPLVLPASTNDFAQVVVDQQGRPLRAFADGDGVWRYAVQEKDVSPLYVEALLNYEDRWFYQHIGVNPFALLRAAWQNIWSDGIVSGGSTITMQVARILYPHERSYRGKLQQMFRALQLEWHLSKQDILQLYLNYAPFGGAIEGVAAASYSYLDKSPDELSHSEAALLAVLPQKPSYLRPDRHPNRAQQARDKVLDRMRGIWSDIDIFEAKEEAVEAVFYGQPLIAPLFSRFARRLHPELSVLKTTLDIDLQQQLESYAKTAVASYPIGTSLSILVVDHTDMTIKGYVGSADFFDNSRYGHVDMVQATRSPGSTLKPFLYAMALDEGLIHSESLLMDAPQRFSDYQPNNFSGGFIGPVSVSEALKRSLNIPAVQVLQALGGNTFSDRLANSGIALNTPQGGNLSVILGGTGTSLWQLVKGYSALANKGQVHELKWLANENSSASRYLMSEGSAWIIRQILRGQKRLDQLNLNRSRYREHNLAWKTGTSYGFRDAWAIGVNTRYTLGVWIGRPDATPLPGFYGANSATPILTELHNFLSESRVTLKQEAPESVSEVDICWPLGTRRSLQKAGHCHLLKQAWVLDEVVPPTLKDTSVEAQLSENPQRIWLNVEGLRVESSCSTKGAQMKEVALWPLRVEPWVAKVHQRSRQIPLWNSTCRQLNTLQDYQHIEMVGIDEGTKIAQASSAADRPSIVLQATGGRGGYTWYVNGLPYPEKWVDSGANDSSREPIVYQFEKAGRYQISVVDSVGNVDRAQISVSFR